MKFAAVFIISLAVWAVPGSHGESPPKENIRHGRKPAPSAAIDHDWLSSEEFMRHLHTLSRAAGTHSPLKVPGYNKKLGEKVFKMHKVQAPHTIDHIVNLSSFYKDNMGGPVDSKAKLEDVAGHRRYLNSHSRRLVNLYVAKIRGEPCFFFFCVVVSLFFLIVCFCKALYLLTPRLTISIHAPCFLSMTMIAITSLV